MGVLLLLGIFGYAEALSCPEYVQPVPLDVKSNVVIQSALRNLDAFLAKVRQSHPASFGLTASFRQEVAAYKVPGLVISVVYDQDTIFTKVKLRRS